jgi:hypothetical protein
MPPFSGKTCKPREQTSKQTRKQASSKQSKFTLLSSVFVLLTLTMNTETACSLELW